MAKAKEITAIDCAADALEWAAEVLRVRFNEVVGLRASALDFSDIEGVHSMRVATRRLRSSLRDFMPLMKKRPLQRARKELKEIADALGAVRDQDVAIVALEALQTEAKTEPIKQGIGRLLEERNKLRDAARLDLTETITAERLNDLRKRFAAAIDKAVKRKKSKKIVSFNEAGRDVVATSWQDLYDLGASLYAPFNVEEIHEMRIAAKRLRYAIELFVACWGEKIARFAKEISDMQSHLGEVHDCDIWIDNIGVRLRETASGDEKIEGDNEALTWLLSEFVKKRTKEYRAALKLWSDWQTTRFAERMREMIETSFSVMQKYRVGDTTKEKIMRTFFLILILTLLISQSLSAQVVTENSSIVVLGSKWSRSRRKIENADNKPETPAQSAMTRTNRNFERNRRVNDMPGTPDPNEGTVEARSAALEKNVQESRSSQTKAVDGFVYQAKIRNTSTRTIEVLFWEYQFKERAGSANASSRQFLCAVNIKPNKEQELSVFSTLSPGDSISANSLDDKAGTLFEEQILINRVEYSDGSILQRQDWNYGKIKTSLTRVLKTPWGQEMCRNL